MFTKIDEIYSQHAEDVKHGLKSVDVAKLQQAADLIVRTMTADQYIFTIGNGASASIAQHWACDFTKGCYDPSRLHGAPRVISLADNSPLMTAISNDLSYEDVFSFQLERLAKKGDLLITISSSGSSPNVVKAVRAAKRMGVKTISLTGFNGGESAREADVNLHVDLQQYEATEDVHQAIMHTLRKYLISVRKH